MEKGRTPLLALCALVCLIAAGCASEDTLDHTVQAETPDKFDEWWHHEQGTLPADLQQELSDAFKIISHRFRGYQFSTVTDNEYDPFCQHVNQLPIRDILVDAKLIENETLWSQIIDGENALTVYNQHNSMAGPEKHQDQWNTVVKFQENYLADLNKQLQKNRSRIKELDPELKL